jgi:hypothetical protein
MVTADMGGLNTWLGESCSYSSSSSSSNPAAIEDEEEDEDDYESNDVRPDYDTHLPPATL